MFRNLYLFPIMNQPTHCRTSREALFVIHAWLWLFIGVVILVGTWGVWTDLKFSLSCITLSVAMIWWDRRKQRNKHSS
jgi:hypothetical protein